MSVTRPITELDFDQIKSSIIDFIKNNPTFTDYSFEGSALNAIADILAYNTHNNAFYANMLHNEGFIETAQKRASVVSKAKELGYVPRSCVCSTAYIDVTVFNVNSGIPATLGRTATFSSGNDNGNYTFSAVDNLTASIIGANHKFSNVKIVNGINGKNRFFIDTVQNPRSMFTIPNKNVDISTLKVYLRDTFSAVGREEYTLTENIYEVDGNSKVFYVQESYSGEYNIYFGDDVIGKQPINGNVVEVDYFVANEFSNSDGCRLFVLADSFGSTTSTNVATKQISFGGSEKEGIESIRANAIKSNSAKERAVTDLDYGLILREKFNFIDSASVWGGEKNVPPVYGKVFISVRPVSGFVVSDATKQEILTPLLRKYSLLTIAPVFVDPSYLYFAASTKIKFSINKTTTNSLEIEGRVKSTIIEYINSISQFNTDYLESVMVSSISNLDAGIVSVSVDKTVSIKLDPLLGVVVSHKGSVNNRILPGSIRSTKFNTFTDVSTVVSIREIPGKVTISTNNLGKIRELQSVGLYTVDNLLMEDIGTINLFTGDYQFAFSLSSYVSGNRFISVKFGLVEDDIQTTRNQILIFDTVGEDASIGLNNNNIVVIEPYDK